MSEDQIDSMSSSEPMAEVGEMSAVARGKHQGQKTGLEILGIQKDEFIYDNLEVSSGSKFTGNNEAVVDASLKSKGYDLGEKVTLSSGGPSFTIVGFTKNANLSVSPMAYLSLHSWQILKLGGSQPTSPARGTVEASALVMQDNPGADAVKGVQVLTIPDFISKLPGYTAQKLTFDFMIGFLFAITMAIMGIFLYILTMQKLKNYTVLKIQGVPTAFLVRAVFVQAVMLSAVGLAVGILLTAITVVALPEAVPIAFDFSSFAIDSVAILLMALVGSLASVAPIVNIKPTSLAA